MTYRRKKKNAQQNLGGNNKSITSKAIADGTQQPPEANNVNTSFQSIPKTGDDKPSSSLDHTEKVLEGILKFEEFNRLAYRHYHPDNARQILAGAILLSDLGHKGFVDKKLEWLRRMDKVRFGQGFFKVSSS